MSKLKEIHNYLISLGKREEELKELDKYSVYLSMEIMEYAHRAQTRDNGEDYANHSSRCMQSYSDLVGIVSDNYNYIDKDLMYEYGIPYDGVQEVCLLHDVTSNSDLTIDDIEEIFNECDLGLYFRLYIKEALNNISHNNEDYLSYMMLCMNNPISAICKMMDLQDNICVTSLTNFDDKDYKRLQEYLMYMFIINQRYHFIENTQKYKEELNKNKQLE